MESMTEEQKEWSRSTPSWIYFVFAISVSAGVAGSICLLMRKRLAVLLFAISFVAVLIQMVHTMLIAGGGRALLLGGLRLLGRSLGGRCLSSFRLGRHSPAIIADLRFLSNFTYRVVNQSTDCASSSIMTALIDER